MKGRLISHVGTLYVTPAPVSRNDVNKIKEANALRPYIIMLDSFIRSMIRTTGAERI